MKYILIFLLSIGITFSSQAQTMNLSKEELSICVGRVIRDLRVNQKISIESLANETEIGYSQLSRIERGKINTSLYQIYLILVTLNAPMNTIMKVLIKAIIKHHIYFQTNKSKNS